MTQLDQARNLLKDGNITEALNCLRQLHLKNILHGWLQKFCRFI